jgi:hypothetical protein
MRGSVPLNELAESRPKVIRRQLGKVHGSQVSQNAEGASLCFLASFTGGLIENASRNEVEKLLENDNIARSGFWFMHLLSGRDPFSSPTFFTLSRHFCGMAVH